MATVPHGQGSSVSEFILEYTKTYSDRSTLRFNVSKALLEYRYKQEKLDIGRLDDLDYVDREMERFEQAFKSLEDRGVLKSIRRDNGVMGVVLNADCVIVNAEKSRRPNVVGVATSDQENEPPSPQSGMAITAGRPAIATSEARKHWEAYNKMIKGAAPIRQGQLGRHSESPSRKRRRLLEVGESDTTSNFDLSSPQRYSTASPRSVFQRRPSPQSETRRKSAPSRILNNPVCETIEREEESATGLRAKPEENDSSPVWLSEAVERLRQKYPADKFQAVSGKIKCLDCEGREFTAGPSHTTNNFEAHLNRRQHQGNAAKRRAQNEHEDPPTAFGPASRPTTANFQYQPVQTPTVSVQQQKGASLGDLRASMTQYFVALENDATLKAIRNTMLEGRIAASEKKNEEKFASLYEQISVFTSEDSSILERLADHGTKHQEELALLSEQLASCKSDIKNSLDGISQDIALSEQRSNAQCIRMFDQATSTIEETRKGLEAITDRLTRSTKSQQRELDDMSLRMSASGNMAQARMQQFAHQIKSLELSRQKQDDHIYDLVSQCQLQPDELIRRREREQEMEKSYAAQIKTSKEEMLVRVHEIEVITSRRLAQLDKRSKEKTLKLASLGNEQKRQDEVLQAIVPQLIEEITELRQEVEELKRQKLEVSRKKAGGHRGRLRTRRVFRRRR